MLTGIIRELQSGNFEMFFILLLGAIALGIFIERFVVLFSKANVDKDKFLSHVHRAVLAGDLNAAVNYCNENKNPLNNIVKAGLVAVMNKGKDEEVQTAMDVEALREVPVIERRTPFLALLANTATLVGLLTTITGLIKSFEAVAKVDPGQKAALLAAGISEAMNGTAFGLIVAIPALLAYAFLSSKTQAVLDDLHEVSVSTLNLIIQNRDKFPSR